MIKLELHEESLKGLMSEVKSKYKNCLSRVERSKKMSIKSAAWGSLMSLPAPATPWLLNFREADWKMSLSRCVKTLKLVLNKININV